MSDSELRYPVGRYNPPTIIEAPQRVGWIDEVEKLPAQLRAAVADLDDTQLANPYRPGGWTVRQVVHHLPDSHINSYVRFRLALTEETPVIKPYDESAWADLSDARTAAIEGSLTLLDCLHWCWVFLLKSMTEEQFARWFRHPDLGQVTLCWSLGLYAWHGRHHVAQITALRERQGW